jgi:hypothetical protein
MDANMWVEYDRIIQDGQRMTPLEYHEARVAKQQEIEKLILSTVECHHVGALYTAKVAGVNHPYCAKCGGESKE